MFTKLNDSRPPTAEEIAIQTLKQQISFLVETFSTRDLEQRMHIEQLEAAVAQQSRAIAWYQGAHAPMQPHEVTQ